MTYSFLAIITIAFAGFGSATAQGPSQGRIYLGTATAAPAWVWQRPKSSFETNQMAVNAAWVKDMELACAEQRLDAQRAMLKSELARADYVADPRNRMLKPEAGGAQLLSERGVILEYNTNTMSGTISGEDGKRWSFRADEWSALRDSPQRGLWVDFVPETETGYALLGYSLGPFRAQHLELEAPR